MNHYARPESQPEIGGAGGQIAVLGILCERKPFREALFHLAQGLGGFLKGEPASECLQADLVFLIDQEAETL